MFIHKSAFFSFYSFFKEIDFISSFLPVINNAEHYKLIQSIKEYPLLRNIILNIKANPKIKLAILFGSYAKGLAHKDSDIDIYIETTSKELKKELEQLNLKASVKIGKYNPDSLLIKEIKKNHVIVKGVEQYYEKSRFFG